MEVGTPLVASTAQWFAYFFMLLVYLFPAVYALIKKRNPQKYPLFVFVWVLYGAFICFPLGRYLNKGAFYFKGILTGNAFGPIAYIYALAFGLIITGYSLGRAIYRNHLPKRKIRGIAQLGKYLNITLYSMPLICIAAFLTDMYWKDANFLSFFNPFHTGSEYERKLFFLYQPVSAFLESFADCFIVAFLALIVYKRNWFYAAILAVFYIAYTLIVGWRYRIILPLLAMILLKFQSLNFKKRYFSVPVSYIFAILLVLGLWGTLFYTSNRFAIGWRNYEDIVYNPLELDVNILFEELSNTQVDALLYNHYQSGQGYHDRGESIFAATFYRAFGAFKPDSNYRAPILIAHTQALQRELSDGNALRAAGSPSQIGEYWYGMGYIGLGLFSFFWGVLLSLEYFYQAHLKYHQLLLATVFMLCFQIITRGYTPQHIELAFFFALPLLIYRLGIQLDKKRVR